MWIGIVIGLLGFGAGFWGLRDRWMQQGRVSEAKRHEAKATMITRALHDKDKLIDAKTTQKIQQIQTAGLARRMKARKLGLDAQKLLERANNWPPV